MFHRLTSLRAALLGAVACSVLLAGCGVRDYNTLMKRRLGSLRNAAKFKYLYGPTELPGSPITVRVPMLYSNSFRADSAHPDDGAVIDPSRLQPPFLRLPSFKLCYEGTTINGQEVLPHYCYLAAMPAQPGDAERVLDQFQAQLKQAFPNSQAEWETVSADTPAGYNILWKKIRFEGEQPFFVKTGDQVEAKILPGIFELWVHDAENYIVLVAWRVPTSIQGSSPMPETQPGQNAVFPGNTKLDLEMWPALTAGTVTKSAADAE